MPWIVVPQQGQPAAPWAPEQVLTAVRRGELSPDAQVSRDGGHSWMTGAQAADLAERDEAALALVVPTRVNGYALVAGHLGVLSLLFFGGPACLVAGIFFAAPKATLAIRAAALASAVLLGPAAPAAFAFMGHRALKRDPSEKGMVRVVTGYVCAALMLVAFVAGAIITVVTS